MARATSERSGGGFCFQYCCSFPFPTNLHDILKPVCYFYSFSHFFRKYDVTETFESLIWLPGRGAWNFLSSSLLPIPCTCLPAAALYLLWAFSVLQLSVLLIGSYLCLLLPSFPWLLRKSHQISISFSFATWRIQSFLWLLPAGLSWYLSRDLLGVTSSCAACNAVNLLVTSAANWIAPKTQMRFKYRC